MAFSTKGDDDRIFAGSDGGGMGRVRLSADARRDQILDAALAVFSIDGYSSTSTAQVARSAGVSQSYVIQLFGTKKKLFIATLVVAMDRMEAEFRIATKGAPAVARLTESFAELLVGRQIPNMIIHGIASSGDPAIGPVVRDCFGRFHSIVRELTQVNEEGARRFISVSLLLTVLGMLEIERSCVLPQQDWLANFD